MSHFTSEQRQALIRIARRYAPAVHALASRNSAAPSTVDEPDASAMIDEFASEIVAVLRRDTSGA